MGLNLKTMPANDMLDVIHYFIEEELAQTQEAQNERHRVRELMYESFYGVPYAYPVPKETRQEMAGGFDMADDPLDGWGYVDPVDVFQTGETKMEHKPYVPPTKMNANSPKPFGGILDGPVN